MALFILLTRLMSEEVEPSFSVQKKEKLVMEEIRKACPEVKWVADYAVLGPCDYLDIFEAPDNETAMKVSSIIRSVAGAHTEIWPAVTWKEYERLIRDVAEHMDLPLATVTLAK